MSGEIDQEVGYVRCEAVTLEGTRCRAPVVHADGRLCWAHSPLTADKREASSHFGGRRPSWRESPREPVDLSTLDRVRAELEEVVSRLKAKDFSPAVANSMIAALREARGLIESAELEAGLQELERRLAEREHRP